MAASIFSANESSPDVRSAALDCYECVVESSDYNVSSSTIRYIVLDMIQSGEFSYAEMIDTLEFVENRSSESLEAENACLAFKAYNSSLLRKALNNANYKTIYLPLLTSSTSSNLPLVECADPNQIQDWLSISGTISWTHYIDETQDDSTISIILDYTPPFSIAMKEFSAGDTLSLDPSQYIYFIK